MKICLLLNFPTEQCGLGRETARGGNPNSVSLCLLVLRSKTALSAGRYLWEQEAPGVFGMLHCNYSHDNLSIYMKMQAGVGVSGSVFSAANIAINALESRFQEW